MKALLTVILLLFTGFIYSQSPISWKYSAIKKDSKTFEIHLTATIDAPWHLYSQTTPDGGPLPTKISFSKNPLIILDGNVKELGKMQTRHEDVFDIDTKFYAENVEFVQTVKLKTAAKTNILGSVEFMVCNDVQCLPPKTVPFTIELK